MTAEKAVSDYADHLDWLVSRHAKKTYKDSYLADKCLGAFRFMKTKSEADAYCRVNLQVAATYFRKLQLQMRGSALTVSQRKLDQYSDFIYGYLFGIKPLAEHLEKQKDPSYEMFSGQSSNGVQTFRLYIASRNLALRPGAPGGYNIEHRVAQIAGVFTLRQAMEAKFQRLIGLDLLDKNGATPRLKHEFHYEFIALHPQYFNFKSVDFVLLKQIYKWCNQVVHGTYEPHPWCSAFVFEKAGGLFESINYGTNEAWSIYNSVAIVNLTQMQADFMTYFGKNYDHGMWSIYPREVEAEVV